MNFGLASIALLSCCILLICCLPSYAAEVSHNSSGGQEQSPNSTIEQFEWQRRRMVEYQLRERGIETERVLAAMSQVPRHQFVDSSLRDLAYSDRPLANMSVKYRIN